MSVVGLSLDLRAARFHYRGRGLFLQTAQVGGLQRPLRGEHPGLLSSHAAGHDGEEGVLLHAANVAALQGVLGGEGTGGPHLVDARAAGARSATSSCAVTATGASNVNASTAMMPENRRRECCIVDTSGSFLSFRMRLRHSRSLRERCPFNWSRAHPQHAAAATGRHAEECSRNLSSFRDE
jgi:hypothetical protein